MDVVVVGVALEQDPKARDWVGVVVVREVPMDVHTVGAHQSNPASGVLHLVIHKVDLGLGRIGADGARNTDSLRGWTRVEIDAG